MNTLPSKTILRRIQTRFKRKNRFFKTANGHSHYQLCTKTQFVDPLKPSQHFVRNFKRPKTDPLHCIALLEAVNYFQANRA